MLKMYCNPIFSVKDEALHKDELETDLGPNNHIGENNLSDACFSDDDEESSIPGEILWYFFVCLFVLGTVFKNLRFH